MKRRNTDTISTRRGRTLWVLLAAVALVAAACGGDGDSSLTGDPSASAADDGATSGDDSGATSGDDATAPAPAEGGETQAETPPAVGNGVIVADLCGGDQFVNGAISIDDLVGWGVFSSNDVSVSGPGVLSATAYNDFGALCNIEVNGDGDFLTVGVSSGSDAYDDVASRYEGTPERIGDWDVVVVDELTPLIMLHTDADGVTDTLFVNWFPEDDSRRNLDEITRVLSPLAEAIATQATVEIPRIEAPALPSWFACDDSSAGVAGLDPSALFAFVGEAAGAPADVELEVSSDITASFGFTECTVRTTQRNLPNVKVQVQESSAQLQDSVDTYLDGWPEAQPDTIAGIDVAIRVDRGFGEGIVFAVVGDTPVEVRVNTIGDTDVDAVVRATTELVFSTIG